MKFAPMVEINILSLCEVQ